MRKADDSFFQKSLEQIAILKILEGLKAGYTLEAPDEMLSLIRKGGAVYLNPHSKLIYVSQGIVGGGGFLSRNRRVAPAVMNTVLTSEVEVQSEQSADVLPQEKDRLTLENFIPYLRKSALEELDRDSVLKEGLQSYVDLKTAIDIGPLKTKTTYSLSNATDRFLRSQNNLLVLQGKSGSGKRLYGRYLEQRLWKAWHPGKYVPLFITLKDIDSFENKKVIENVLRQKITRSLV